jgi:hypothetical protein
MVYFSLLEKYEYDYHQHKLLILPKIKSESLQKVLDFQRWKKKTQAPDLLVYKPDFSDWFLCEVKGGKDRLREEQESRFEILSALSGKPVYLININLIKARENK